jgi:hypothetical protein
MHDYQKLAPILDALKPDPTARLHYDLFADALVWSDELPASEDRPSCVLIGSELRGIWHYRTSLILGNPVEKFRPAWEEAVRCFPNWPGFDPKRRDASLAATFLTMQDTAMKKWEADEKRIEEQLAKKPQKASA